jgi:hypothetical protein
MLAALAFAAALVAAPIGHADGDPASDVLYSSNLFASYYSGISPAGLKALAATIDDSKKTGYEIRVAVISKPDELGSVTALWAKPKQYARFLGTELGIVYTGPVLIVMPNGVGFYHKGQDPTAAYAALQSIQTGSGDTLAQAAIDSVAALARQAGHPFTPATIPAASESSRWATLRFVALAAVLALAVGVTAFTIYRRRRN